MLKGASFSAHSKKSCLIPDSSSFTKIEAVICIAETKASPSSIPDFLIISKTSSVIFMISLLFLVLIHKYSVYVFIIEVFKTIHPFTLAKTSNKDINNLLFADYCTMKHQ